MSQNNQNINATAEQEGKDMVFQPNDDLQIVMKSGLPVSVILPIEEFDRMTCIIALAEELLDGQQFDMANGQKGSFQELADERVAADRAEYEADLASMFEDDEDEEETLS